MDLGYNKTILTDKAFSNLINLTYLRLDLNENKTIFTNAAFYNINKSINIIIHSDNIEL